MTGRECTLSMKEFLFFTIRILHEGNIKFFGKIQQSTNRNLTMVYRFPCRDLVNDRSKFLDNKEITIKLSELM